MTQIQEIGHDTRQEFRRCHDGSIDFDFYRAQAAALRNEAIRDAFRPDGLARLRTPFRRWWTRAVQQLPGKRARSAPFR